VSISPLGGVYCVGQTESWQCPKLLGDHAIKEHLSVESDISKSIAWAMRMSPS